MNELPSLEADLSPFLRDLEDIAKEYPGRLTGVDLEFVMRKLERLVPPGKYSGLATVEVLGLGYDESRPAVSNVYVEFRSMCHRERDRLPILLFMETHRFQGRDILI